jgi:lipoate-protein ligase A
LPDKTVFVVLRFVRTEDGSPFLNLALEESLFYLQRGLTVRVWDNGPSVIIGRGQLAKYETNLHLCARKNVPVVRRFTAGGAVYNGPGNLNWSIFTARDSYPNWDSFVRNPKALFNLGSKIVVGSLKTLGVKSAFEEPNRIITENGKITGMAAYLAKERALCHGTLLLHADLDEVLGLTTPAKEQIPKRYTRSTNATVANVGLEVERFVEGFRTAVQQEFDTGLEDSRLTSPELQKGEELVRSKYSLDSWSLGDPFSSDYS